MTIAKLPRLTETDQGTAHRNVQHFVTRLAKSHLGVYLFG